MINIFYIILFSVIFYFYNLFYAALFSVCFYFFILIIKKITSGVFDKKYLIIFLIYLFFCFFAFFFKNDFFIKLKFTVVYWIFSIVLLTAHFYDHAFLTNFLKIKIISNKRTLFLILSVYFFLLGAFNIYIAYNCTTNTWFMFKLVWSSLMTATFIVLLFFVFRKKIVFIKIN